MIMADKDGKTKEISNHSKARRKQLLDATLRAISRNGLTGITVNDIAREAGCSYGVIAFHFQTKENLLLSALDHLVDGYGRILRAELAKTPEDPAARLRTLIDVDFDPRVAKTGHLAVWMAFWAEASRVPAYRQHCNTLKEESLLLMTSLIEALTRQLGRDEDARMIAEVLYAITDGAWVFNHVTGQNRPERRERGKQLCLAYLGAVFPEEFGPAPHSRPQPTATHRRE